jgi:hypothetical protein
MAAIAAIAASIAAIAALMITEQQSSLCSDNLCPFYLAQFGASPHLSIIVHLIDHFRPATKSLFILHCLG